MRLVALLGGARFARGGRLVGCRPGRVAPGLLPIRAFAQGRAAIRPFAFPRRSSARHSSVAPVFRDCPGCSCERAGKSRSWAFPLCLVARSRPGFHLAGRTPRFAGVKCRPSSLSSPHRAGWRPKPARALHRGKRYRSAFRFRSRRPQFCTSANGPKALAGWLRCKLSVFVSRCTYPLKFRGLGPEFRGFVLSRHTKAAPLARVAQAKSAGVIHNPRTLRWIVIVQRRSAAFGAAYQSWSLHHARSS